MGFLIFLFVLVAFFWILPRLLMRLLVHKVNKQARGAFRGYQNDARQRKPGWSTPTPHKKKFDKEVGEYVHYEDIETTTTTIETETDTATYTETESRIIDAEWEDI